MSETPNQRQTGINRGGAQVGSVEPNSRPPGSQSLQAGGEFLKALASDLAAGADRLRTWLTPKRRPTRVSQASMPSRVSPPTTIGRVLWRVSIILLGLGTICAGALSAVTLWVLLGVPIEPRKSDAEPLGLAFEARKGEAFGGAGPLKPGETRQREMGREAGAQGRSAAEATIPSMASSGASVPAQSDHGADGSLQGSGSSVADAAEQRETTGTRNKALAGADQPQLARTETPDRRSAARQPEFSKALTDSRPPIQCNVDLCAATYKSFNATDCTYQPYGGGPRSICEPGTRSDEARPQPSRAATDTKSEKDTRVAERSEESSKPAALARTGTQCNVDFCAGKYASFHAADCTYQPYGGGPRRICER